MNSPYKLRLQDEPPYSPVVPEELPAAPPPPPPDAVRKPEPKYVSAEEMDIVAEIEAQERVDAAHESMTGAILGGLGAAVLCVVIAGGFAALTHFWHPVFALGIAYFVARAVRRFGRGNDARFGFLGAFWALAGCLGSYAFAWTFVLAEQYGVSVLTLIREVDDWHKWSAGIRGWGSLFCYALAAVCGYKFSHNAVADRY